jgi:hypothetical protein
MEITIQQLNNLFWDAIERISGDFSQKNDEQIEYDILEEYDIGVRSFLHDDSLNRLVEEGLLSNEIALLSKELRAKSLAIDDENWNLDDIKNGKEWQELNKLANRILGMKDALGKKKE